MSIVSYFVALISLIIALDNRHTIKEIKSNYKNVIILNRKGNIMGDFDE